MYNNRRHFITHPAYVYNDLSSLGFLGIADKSPQTLYDVYIRTAAVA